MLNKLFAKRTKADDASNRWVFGTMLVCGVLGLIAAFTLTLEKLQVLENPNAILSCNFNLILNCGHVMQTWQSHVFGFPNMLIGMMAYPVVITVATAGLAGVRFPKWFLVTANIFYLLGALFAYWLFFQSLYAIQVLCPWCLLVTFATTLILATLTHYNLRNNTFGLKSSRNKRVQEILFKDYDKLAVAAWIVILVGLVFLKFGDSLFA